MRFVWPPLPAECPSTTQQKFLLFSVYLNILAMMVQETHLKLNGIHELRSSDNKTLYLYNAGHESKSIRGFEYGHCRYRTC